MARSRNPTGEERVNRPRRVPTSFGLSTLGRRFSTLGVCKSAAGFVGNAPSLVKKRKKERIDARLRETVAVDFPCRFRLSR